MVMVARERVREKVGRVGVRVRVGRGGVSFWTIHSGLPYHVATSAMSCLKDGWTVDGAEPVAKLIEPTFALLAGVVDHC